jgi:hypothetical protein
VGKTEGWAMSKQKQSKAEERRKQIVKVITHHKSNGAELFHTPDDVPFARVPVGDHYENWPLYSEKFELLLMRSFYTMIGKVPSKSDISDTLRQMEGVATFERGKAPPPNFWPNSIVPRKTNSAETRRGRRAEEECRRCSHGPKQTYELLALP